MEAKFKRGDRVRITSSVANANGRTGAVCCCDDLYNAIGVVRDDGVEGGGQHGCYLVNVDGLEIIPTTPIKPSSLRVGQRVEFSNIPAGIRHVGVVRAVCASHAHVLVDGTEWEISDALAAERAIRILDPAPAPAQSDRRVDASERDFGDAAPAPFQSVALPQSGFTRNPEAAHLTRVAEGQAQQIDRLVEERDAARMEVSLLRHKLEQARAIERENMQAKAVVARLVAENERLRGVRSTETLATESYEEP